MKRTAAVLLLSALFAGSTAAFYFGSVAYGPVRQNNLAIEALEGGDYDRAIVLLESALGKHPGNPVFRRNLMAAYNSRAIGFEKTGATTSALESYTKALVLEPLNQTLLRNYISLLNNLAVESSRGRAFPDSQRLFERAGESLARLDDAQLRTDIQHNYSALLTLWGAELLKSNRYEEAGRSFAQALSLDAQNSVAHIYMGDVHYEANDYVQAKAHYDTALPLDTANTDYLRNRVQMIEDELAIEPRLQSHEDPQGKFLIQYPVTSGDARIGRLLEFLHEARAEVGKALGLETVRPVSVKVYATRDFQRVSRLPEWAIGIFDGKVRLKLEDVQAADTQVRDLAFHEYTHAVLAANIKQRIPAWFHEGLAQMMEPQFAESAREQARMRDALAQRALTFESLNESFKEIHSRKEAEGAYLLSKYFLVDLNRRHGREKLLEWLRRLTVEEDFEESFAAVYGVALADAQQTWITSQSRR